MELTKEQLKQLLPKNPYIDQWHHALSQLLPDYEINTPQRIAAFIAQCAHESGNFVFLSENLNYKAESLVKIFGKYFKDIGTAKQYEKQPAKIANKIYADRMGNGNEASGDGFKYRGRGLIQGAAGAEAWCGPPADADGRCPPNRGLEFGSSAS